MPSREAFESSPPYRRRATCGTFSHPHTFAFQQSHEYHLQCVPLVLVPLFPRRLRYAAKQRALLEMLRARHMAAVRIQACWRGKRACDAYASRRAFALSAVEIQRVYRGVIGRRKANRRLEWAKTEHGPARLKLGMRLIEDTKVRHRGRSPIGRRTLKPTKKRRTYFLCCRFRWSELQLFSPWQKREKGYTDHVATFYSYFLL